MKIDFSQKLYTLKNQPIKMSQEDPEQLTLETAVERSLDYIAQNTSLNAEQKYKRGKLREAIIKSSDGDFTAEEISLMKEAVGQCYWTPSVQTIIWDILDQKETPKLEVVNG